MDYFSTMFSGFSQIFALETLPFLFLGATLGIIIGVIPGLGGHFAMAMVIPFMFGMEPAAALVFILAAHATVAQGGGVTTILFSTPGTGQNVATMFDGPPLTKKGKGGIAIGAAMTACFLGATFGAIVLALLIPILRQIVLVFSPGDFFMLGVLALSFVAVLSSSENSPVSKGLMSTLLGITLAFTGLSSTTAEPRFTFGFLQLWEGIPMVAAIMGVFSVAELVTLWVKRTSFSQGEKGQSNKVVYKDMLIGVLEAFKRIKTILRGGAIGSSFGLIPGLGSSAAAFVAYGQARRASKNPENFGKGELDGVVAPESANDAVEGGALASTVAFGIPGSSSMAILLSALTVIGIQPGMKFMETELDLVFVMIGTIVLGNLIGTIIGIGISNPLVRLTTLDYRLLVPLFSIVIFTGALAYHGRFFDLVIMLLFGTLGYFLKIYGYSRASFLLGFVLGSMIERNLYLAIELHGPQFIFKPITFTLLLLVLGVFTYNIWKFLKTRRGIG